MKKTIRTATVLCTAALLLAGSVPVQAADYCDGLEFLDGSTNFLVDNYSGMPAHVTVYFARPTSDGVTWKFDYEFQSAEPCDVDGFYDFFEYLVSMNVMDVVEETDSGLSIYRSQFGVNEGKYQFSGKYEGCITLTPDGLDPETYTGNTAVNVTGDDTTIFVIYEQDADTYLDELIAFADKTLHPVVDKSGMAQWASDSAAMQETEDTETEVLEDTESTAPSMDGFLSDTISSAEEDTETETEDTGTNIPPAILIVLGVLCLVLAWKALKYVMKGGRK
jgi:hypothetical protein